MRGNIYWCPCPLALQRSQTSSTVDDRGRAGGANHGPRRQGTKGPKALDKGDKVVLIFQSPPTPHRRNKELCALLFLPWSILHWTFLCAFHFTFDFMGLYIVNHLIKWDFGVLSVGQFSFCILPLWDFGANSFNRKVEKQ
jgi:hypothetical protein